MEASPPTLEIAEALELPVSLRRLGALLLDERPDNGAAQASPLRSDFPDGLPDPRTVAVGTTVRHVVTFMGLPTEIAWTVAEWEPLESIALTGVGPMSAELAFSGRIALIAGGVRADYRLTIGGAALAPMLPAIEPQLRQAAVQAQERLRRLLAA